MKRILRVVAAVIAVAAVLSTTEVAGAEPPPTYQPDSVNPIRKPDGSGGWTDTSCTNFPIDNVWHAVVDRPGTPLINDDRSDLLTLDQGGYNAADIPVFAGFNSSGTAPGSPQTDNKVGEGLNYVDNSGTSRGFAHAAAVAQSSDWTFATFTWLFGQRIPTYRSTHVAPSPASIRWTANSTDTTTDNRMYILNTDECETQEFIGFNGLLRNTAPYQVRRQANFDLTSNNRRASRNWSEPSCPTTLNTTTTNVASGFFRPNCSAPQVKNSSARGGSGLSGVAGLLRVEEVLAATASTNPRPIDHAIGVTLPQNLIACEQCSGAPAISSVWPASTSDGSGGVLTVGADTFAPLPMGSRLRLSADISPSDFTGQARAIVEALQRHGMIVHDSKAPIDLTDVNASQRSIVLAGEWHKDWNNTELLQLRDLRLADFELVDQQDMRANNAGPQDNGFLTIR